MKRERRVLIVEDDREIREVLVHALGFSGYDVRDVAEGHAALALIEEWVPGVIVLDLLMPEMDGIAFLARLAERRGGEIIPIIVLSAIHHLDKVVTPYPIAAAIAKPFDLTVLLDALAAIEEEARAGERLRSDACGGDLLVLA